MKPIYFYDKGCLNCHYISLLMKKMNIYDLFDKIECDSKEGIEIKKKYNLTTAPVILILDDNHNVIKLYNNIEKPDLVNVSKFIQQ